MKPELLKKFKALKGKSVTVTYGVRHIDESGVLLSYTAGTGAKVWLTDHRRDITIPVDLITDVKELA